MNYSIKTLNSISARGLSKLPESYEVGPHVDNADAWLVRSANLHSVEIPDSVLAISRAGAGTNTIPVNQLSGRGVVVFNTPGSNANAVKELVLAGILLGARNILPAAAFARQLTGDDNEINAAVEAGKKQFVGWELPGRTLGVIGLGEVGVQVANAAEALGMKVLGYDPAITIRHAWQLSSHVTRAASIDEVFRRADVLTVHVPLIEATQGLVNAERLALMKQRALVLNFSRAGIVDSPAMVAALESGSIRGYVLGIARFTLIHWARRQRRFDPAEFQFLAGWRNGRAVAYRGVRRIVAHPDYVYEGRNRMDRVAYDLAFLELDQPIRLPSIRPFEIGQDPVQGDQVGVVSYALDRADAPALQKSCDVLGRQPGVLVFTCSVDFGSSGAPIFTMAGGVPRIVSVVSAKAELNSEPVALGTEMSGPLAELQAAYDQGAATLIIRGPSSGTHVFGVSGETTAKFLKP